jgi:hypothetical protein
MAALDTDADELKELLANAVPGKVIEALLKWHNTRIERAQRDTLIDSMRTVAAAIWGRGDANIRLAALAYVGGLECSVGKSMAQFAREIGCTRAAISKEANIWRDKLSMSSSAMRSEQARDSYSRRQRALSSKRQSKSLS